MRIADVAPECGGFPSHRFDFAHERLSFSPIRAISEDDVGAALMMAVLSVMVFLPP